MGVLTNIIRQYDPQYREGSASRSGSSDQEIAAVSEAIGSPLCSAHIEFLRWMGCDYHGHFVGTDVFTRDILDNTKVLSEVFQEEGISDFPLANLVCFYGHQGYVYAWYYSDEGPDPMVHFFTEVEHKDDARGFTITSDQRFSEFVATHLAALAHIRS